jgi:hypothetical protein
MGLSFTLIQKEWFYYIEGEKTKLNWLLLETALEHYGRIRDCGALAAYREQHGEDQIAQFCAYYARRMRKRLLDCLRGRAKSVICDQAYVADFYPQHGCQLAGTLNHAANEAWGPMLAGCGGGCPQQCLRDHKARNPLFDEY